MGLHAVILGAGIGGLAVGIRLARAGHDVDILDRDPAPPADVALAFDAWDRRSVTQWQQYHVFRARARLELTRSLPDILDRLRELGVEMREGDELAGIPVRRPILEWVLRREAERTRGLHLRPDTIVRGLHHDERRTRVVGVVASDGARVDADIVLDCGGRRSPIGRWVTDAGYEREPARRLSCGIAYYTRYYEQVGGGDRTTLGQGGIEVYDDGFMAHALAVGDRGTIGAIFVAPATPEFRPLGTRAGWERAVRCTPRMAEVLTECHRPIMEPAAMNGLENVLDPWSADGVRGPRRLAHLGDAWLVTNPNLAWGSSVALAHANALADAITDHRTDVDAGLDSYRARVGDEVEQLFEAAGAADRSILHRWGLSETGPTADDLDREALLFGLGRLAKQGDLDLATRLGRRANLLELPDDLWVDEPLLDRARDQLRRKPFDPDHGPSRHGRGAFLDAIGTSPARKRLDDVATELRATPRGRTSEPRGR
jgi:2-polyprenyl-6-methoxyphenol hydroxylase-like FAD-dependent oxidoreductase